MNMTHAVALTSVQVDETLCLITGIVDAMVFLHSRKLMHRDLKSHNIVVNQRKEPIVVDLGSVVRHTHVPCHI